MTLNINRTTLSTPKNDTLTGAGNATINGNEGSDVLLSGGVGRNTLRGGKGNDTLFGFANDQLFGDQGDDILYAGSSSRLTGGEGRDRFVVTNGSLPAGINTITDFTPDTDLIVFKGTVGRYSGLQISARGSGSVIRFNGLDVVTISNVAPARLGRENFVFE